MKFPIALTLVLLAGMSVPARGDETADRAEAKRLRDLSLVALAAGNGELALEELKRAYRVFPSANLKFNIGLVLAGQGRKVEAADVFREFLDETTNAPSDAVQHAKRALVELEHELGQVIVSANVARTEISIDDRTVGKTPLKTSRYLWPGTHRIRAQATAHEPAVEEVLVEAGVKRSVLFRLAAIRDEMVVSRPVKIASLSLGGAGAAALIVGVGLLGHYGAVYGSALDSFDQFSTLHRSDGERIGGAVMAAAGAALLASGVILYFAKRHPLRTSWQ